MTVVGRLTTVLRRSPARDTPEDTRYDGAPHRGQCEGCTTTAWHLKDAVYPNARGVSFAILTTGRWEKVASHVEFMGDTQPGYSVRDADAPVGGEMGYLASFLRDGDPTWGLTRRPVPQWTRPGATPEETLGRHGHHH